jgi:hypothetical protein
MSPIANPYPASWTALAGFEYMSALRLVRPLNTVQDRLGEDGDYVLDRDFDVCLLVDGRGHSVTAPRRLITDLTSVPPVFRTFVGRVGPWLEAAILHDWLYVAWQVIPGKEATAGDRAFADRVMLLAMEAARVGWLRRTAIYLALRLFGEASYRRRRKRIFAELAGPAFDTPIVIPTS